MAEIFQQGVDVSRYQGQIDWRKVKAAGQQYAIIRAVSSSKTGPYIDPFFQEHIQQAQAAGLRVGAYYYTYALNEQQAIAELELVLEALQGLKLEYPVFVDMEDSSIAALGRQAATNLARFALVVLDQKGWYSGLYTYTSFAQNNLDMSQLQEWPLFIADYRGFVGYPGRYDMWQFSSTGRVDGISTNTDLSYSYTDFLPRIIEGGYNGFEPLPTMIPLNNTQLEVFATNTEYFNGPDVNDIQGRLPLGFYPALTRSTGSYNGFEWVTFLFNGQEYWTALLDDRTRLVAGNDCCAQLEEALLQLQKKDAIMNATAQQLRQLADDLENG